jgi:hypothetical protein
MMEIKPGDVVGPLVIDGQLYQMDGCTLIRSGVFVNGLLVTRADVTLRSATEALAIDSVEAFEDVT